ncbi:acyl-homoserine-lactone synthase [Cupriavidus pauculus]|uniref:Acyl-homoserine-lactone synthase n=1 Tax=Cupriavidus pauculus TaxID=82633 RepID=A0A2N5C6X2_9BURK|nr:acyl-homoserine-lactone synthase [Cupriavidus pauculus]PLP97930.1 acyl-homoserine-lactone synthase SolI [Cupriavidus pauculus]
MRIVSGNSTYLQPAMMARLARYRHEVFVHRLGWQLSCADGCEVDQFDREDTVYVVVLNKRTGAIRGTARLLPTTRPYLLREVFPALLDDMPAPESADVWELSRFAVVDLEAPATIRNGQFSSCTATALLRATLMCAAELGARELVAVSPVSVQRLLRRAGVVHLGRAPRATGTKPRATCAVSDISDISDTSDLFACRIEVVPFPVNPQCNPGAVPRAIPGAIC